MSISVAVKQMFRRSKPSACLYTAIFGQREHELDKAWLEFGLPVLCFTDRKDLRCPGFMMRYSPPLFEDPNRSAKMFKVLPHLFLPDYSSSVWFDANMRPKKCDLRRLVKSISATADFALFAHPTRSCIYDEARACVEHRRDRPDVLNAQMDEYKRRGYPANNNLYACGFLIRNHLKESVIKISSSWWEEITTFSRRDQISLPVVLNAQNVSPYLIPGHCWKNEIFTCAPHGGPEMRLA